MRTRNAARRDGSPLPLVPPGQMGRRFWSLLVLVLVVAGTLQVAQVQRRAGDLGYDGPTYAGDAMVLAEGRGFIGTEALFFAGVRRESAIHPPGNAAWLSVSHLAGYRSALAKQRQHVVLGVAAVLAIALAARLVAGDRAGLLAGALAAVHPAVWSYPALAMSETPAQALVALTVLCMLRWWRSPSVLWAAATGGACALAALTRSEQVVLLPILVLAMLRHPEVGGVRLRHAGAAVLWAGVLLGPWLTFNLLRFEEPVLLATGLDIAMSASNCPPAYHGPRIGGWILLCRPVSDLERHPDGSPLDESEEGSILRDQAVEQMRREVGWLPVVMGARIARTFALWDPIVLADQETAEHREVPVMLGANAVFLLLAVPAVAGARRLHRAGWTLAPVVAPVVAAVLLAAMTQGSTRYRSGADVVVVLLAAVAIDGWWRDRSTSPGTTVVAP